MKTNTVETIIEDFRNGQNIFRRPSVELLVREVSRLQSRIEWLDGDRSQLSEKIFVKDKRIEELEAEQGWIPVSEKPKENNIEVICYSEEAPNYKSYFADYTDGKFVDVDCNYHEIYPRPTHYQYKPHPPKDGE